MPFKNFRDVAIDIVRGIAIFVMIAANMAPLLSEQPSYLMRVIYSCAAPIFITLAGMMVARTVLASSQHGFAYFLQRGLFLLAMGGMIDMVAYRYVPFLGIDVLYLLGISMPIVFLLSKMSTKWVVLAMGMIFSMTIVMQKFLGYIEVPTLAYLGQREILDPVVIVKHWLVDGWFPLFPWLGYGVAGILLARLRWEGAEVPRRFDNPKIFLSSATLCLIGMVVMNAFPGPQYARAGYQELFYPVSAGFLIWSLAMVAGVIGFVDASVKFTVWRIIQPLGEASLFVYLGHSLFIGKVYQPFFAPMNHQQCFGYFMVLLGVMWVSSLWLRTVRKTYPNMPAKLRWVIG